jgi:hypothetical protein
MPYDPAASNHDDRGFVLVIMWIGLAASLVFLAGKLLGSDLFPGLPLGVTAGSLIGLLFVGRQDEYFQRLAAIAARWACAVVGFWLLASEISATEAYVSDRGLGLAIVAATFHVRFAIARLIGG